MFIGRDGFNWFVGVVEDNVDPLVLGRTKVRIFGYHPKYQSGSTGIPTADLPWATQMSSANGQRIYSRLGKGEWVLGFFMDGPDAQEPVIIGVLPANIEEGGVVQPGDLFGRFGTTHRSFAHVTANRKPWDTSNVEFRKVLEQVAWESESGHTLRFQDHVDTNKVILSHNNGTSYLEITDAHVYVANAQGRKQLTDDPPPPPSGGGGKIICTKLYELGYLPYEIYQLDQEFGRILVDRSPDTYNGYVAWAQVVVQWMEGNGPQCMFWIRDENKRREKQIYLSTKWAREIATPWASHMAYLMGSEKDKNVAGEVLMNLGKPICKVIGVWQRWFGKSDKPTGLFKGFLLWGIFAFLRFLVWFYRNVK